MTRPSSERDGECVCDYNPSTTEGPLEDCPFHGRPYAYWIERGDALAERLAAAETAIARARALAEDWRYKGEHGWGPWQEGHGPDFEGQVLDQAAADLRRALDGDRGTAAEGPSNTPPTRRHLDDLGLRWPRL